MIEEHEDEWKEIFIIVPFVCLLSLATVGAIWLIVEFAKWLEAL